MRHLLTALQTEKPNAAVDVRTLLLSEPLLKLASSVLYIMEAKKIMPLFMSTQQHALGSPAAAPGMLLEARATAASRPTAAVFSGDVSNAFGCMSGCRLCRRC